MSLSPRVIALLLATLITALTLTFLSFVEGVTDTILFVVGITSFTLSLLLVYYAIELLVFREVNKMYKTIHKLRIRDFTISRKSIIKNTNPFKKLNDEVFVYVAKKQKEIDELKRLEQFRREFLADVSHELKTPIFAAQGFIHTLIDGAINDELVRDRFLSKAARSLDGLDALVKDLVALSQLETGEVTMNMERVNLVPIVQEIFDQLENSVHGKGTSLIIKGAKPGGIWVRADAQRITQVMTNLIENAVKYGKENGQVVVSLEEDRKHFQISVRDDGPGIPPEHLNRIFERFYRVEKSRSKDRGGTGLGLAIVKHILSAHKTKITVMSKVDKGTTFRFKLDNAE